MEKNISERAQSLFKSLVEYYIREGQPVGSTTLARESGLDLSPATIRNVIADLEKLGLVHSPHTSAGRVPTVKGYRMFIDDLLTVTPPNQDEMAQLETSINVQDDTHKLLESATAMLSGMTKMAAIVTVPNKDRTMIRQIEFLPLSDNRILAILVFGAQDVQNRIIHSNRAYSTEELQRIANCLNTEFLGQNLTEVRRKLVSEMENARDNMDRIMLNAIQMANKVFREDSKSDFIISGETNLMKYDEMADVGRLRHLFEAFNEKQGILNLLDKSVHAPGVQIFIGHESHYDALDDCSVITATYADEGRVIGCLGVIGPTRMAYNRVIPIVDVSARMLGAVIKQRP